METAEAAQAAIADPNPVIDGRKANVNLAYLGVKAKVPQSSKKKISFDFNQYIDEKKKI